MFKRNYSKPGKGVNKRDPNQSRLQIFKEILPRKLWDLIKLNMLYLLISIPFFIVTMVIVGVVSSPISDLFASMVDNTVLISIDIVLRVVFAFLFMIFLGQGPVTAGYTYIIREHGREHPCWLISDFFERVKSNFRQGILLWFIDLTAFYILVVAFKFYMQNGIFILQYVILLIGVVYVMMHIYVYQMMVTFNLPLKSILKNSFILAIVKVPINLFILLFNIIMYVAIPVIVFFTVTGIWWMFLLFVAEVFIFPPVTAFIASFCIDPILDKYINIENKIEEN